MVPLLPLLQPATQLPLAPGLQTLQASPALCNTLLLVLLLACRCQHHSHAQNSCRSVVNCGGHLTGCHPGLSVRAVAHTLGSAGCPLRPLTCRRNLLPMAGAICMPPPCLARRPSRQASCLPLQSAYHHMLDSPTARWAARDGPPTPSAHASIAWRCTLLRVRRLRRLSPEAACLRPSIPSQTSSCTAWHCRLSSVLTETD
jgi:hypothetical protein